MEKIIYEQQKKKEDVHSFDEQNIKEENYAVDSWLRLKDRYVNLWRSRIRQEEYVIGIRDSLLSGLGLSTFLLLTNPINPIYVSLTYLYIGSTIGAGISGYRNKLDFFGGFHIGLLTSSLFMLFAIISSFLIDPVITFTLLPVLLFYVLAIGITHGMYATIGRSLRDDTKSRPKTEHH